MALKDDKLERSKASTTLTTPFSIAALSMTSSRPAKRIRNIATREAMLPPKSSQNRHSPQENSPQSSDDHPRRDAMPSSDAGSPVIAGATTHDQESSENSSPDVSSPQPAAPRSIVSQVSRVSIKRSRAKTSRIHEYISTRGDHFVCNRCSKTYKSSGGTGAISRHLKKAHFIDATAGRQAEKKIRGGTAKDATILRGAEINSKAEETRREQLMDAGLNKTVLEYLFHQWITKYEMSPEDLRNPAFRAFLEYVNPVASRMLLESRLGSNDFV